MVWSIAIISYLWLLVWRVNPNAYKELFAAPCLSVKSLSRDPPLSLQIFHTNITYISCLTFTTTVPIFIFIIIFIICSFLATVCKWMDCCLKCTEILAAKIPLRSRASGGGWVTLCPFLLPLCFCPGRHESTTRNGQDLGKLHCNAPNF